MGEQTGIAWTDSTWNPVRGCTKVSEGCRHCWAMRMAARFSKPGLWGAGFAEMIDGEPRWTGRVELIPEMLTRPLRWRKPRRIFLSSFDLFHEALPDEAVDRVFAVMALAPRHTFQVLTKRPARMRAYSSALDVRARVTDAMHAIGRALEATWSDAALRRSMYAATPAEIRHAENDWPLQNVWKGTSVEDQPTADQRIHEVLGTPAAVRFVSYEPALGPVDFDQPRCQFHDRDHVAIDTLSGEECCGECVADGSGGELSHGWWLGDAETGLDWIIVGGESGPGARPFDVAWARSTIAQCQAAGVACFVKQLGANVGEPGWEPRTRVVHETGAMGPFIVRDRAGEDPLEWPEDLRVQQFPEART